MVVDLHDLAMVEDIKGAKPSGTDAKPPDSPDPVVVGAQTTSQAPSQASIWNTKNFGWRLGGDLTAAASAAVMVAPIITIIDKYVPTILMSQFSPIKN
jgi:hypothetical protein